MQSSRFHRRIKDALKDPYTIISLSVLVALVVFSVVRAATMPITIDESRTYFQTIMPGPRVISTQFHGQNHTLQSYLSFFGVELFGLSLLSLRLGPLLGFIIYVIACIHLSRICTRSKWLFCLSLLSLTINPVILDFAVVARGYSLALAFFMVALGLCASRIQGGTHRDTTKWEMVLISCLCSLSVLSNLSFAFANVSLLAIFVVWLLLKTRSAGRIAINLLLAAVPGTLLFVLLNPAVFHFDMVTFYFGSASWWEFYESLTEISFGSRFSFLRLVPLSLGAGVLGFAGLIMVPGLVRNESQSPARDANSRVWLFLSAVCALIVFIHWLFHWILSRPLPKDRTGLFLVPLAILIVVSSITGLQMIHKSSRLAAILVRGSAIVLGVLVLTFLLNLRISWVYVWKFDAGGPEVASFVSNYAREHGIRQAGTQWPLDQALRFYPALKKESDFPELHELSLPTDASRESLFVLHTRQSPFITKENLKIIFEHPLSEVVVAVRN